MDGDIVLRLMLPKSKTDQYNEGQVMVIRSIDRPLCPVTAFASAIHAAPASQEDDPAFTRPLRLKLALVLKSEAVSLDMDNAKWGRILSAQAGPR